MLNVTYGVQVILCNKLILTVRIVIKNNKTCIIVFCLYKVSSALAYLHTRKNIVHFDIKPDNVLIFKYPQPGHYCFSTEVSSLLCDSCYGEGGGILVKLADLGVSAFVCPSGFHRSNTTPTYSAPEVLKYSGKEPLTEKVYK